MSIASPPSRSPRGFTLLEMAVVLAFLGLAVSALLRAARGQMDRLAVLGAREEVVGIIHRARQEAVAVGGAEVVLTSDDSGVDLLAAGDTLLRSDLHAAYGVRMSFSRPGSRVTLTFGPLGLGRVSSQTLRFNRGAQEAVAVISSLGRVVRR